MQFLYQGALVGVGGALLGLVLASLNQARQRWKTIAEHTMGRNAELMNVAVMAERAKVKAEQDLAYFKHTLETLAQREIAAVLNDEQFAVLQRSIMSYIDTANNPDRIN